MKLEFFLETDDQFVVNGYELKIYFLHDVIDWPFTERPNIAQNPGGMQHIVPVPRNLWHNIATASISGYKSSCGLH